jgi:hypothetical protein
MQPAEDRLTGYGPGIPALHGPWLRGILAQAKMSSRPVVVGQVLLQHPPQVLLAEHDHVIEALPPDRPDDPFAVSVLPWSAWRGDDLLDAYHFQGIQDRLSVDSVSIPNQVSRCRVERERLDQLRACPGGLWFGREVEVDNAPSVERQDQEDVQGPEHGRGTVKKSIAAISAMWFRMKVCQDWVGVPGRRTMYLAIVDSEMS